MKKTPIMLMLISAVMALILLYQFFFAETTLINRGLGWDGVEYARVAKNFEKIIRTKDIDNYRIQRILPSAIVHYALKAFKIPLTDNNIIAAFKIYNFLLLVMMGIVWIRLSKISRFSVSGTVFGLVGLFFNFAILKNNFYQPVLTDTTALVLGLLLIYFYLTGRQKLLLFTAVLGFFTWPTVFLCALPLYIFPKRINMQIQDRKNKFYIIIFLLFLLPSVTLTIYSVFLKHVTIALGNQVIKKEYILLSWSGLVFYYLFATKGLLEYVSVKKLLTYTKIPGIYLRVVIVIAIYFVLTTLSNNFTSAVFPLSISKFAIHNILLSITKPYIFYLAHIVYFGPILLLFFWYFPKIARVVNKSGFGMTLVFLVNISLFLSSQSRTAINFFPFVVYFTIMYLDKTCFFSQNKKFAVIFILFAVFASKFWLHIGYNIDLYYMNFGPWMRDEWYILQGVIISALSLGFLIFNL